MSGSLKKSACLPDLLLLYSTPFALSRASKGASLGTPCSRCCRFSTGMSFPLQPAAAAHQADVPVLAAVCWPALQAHTAE